METTERIVEAYVRYVKGWATIPNIKCDGQFEIDLLAIDPVSFDRYHIETSVSVSGGFSKLTDNPFSEEKHKERIEKPKQRRTLGFFLNKKFGADNVKKQLKRYGFKTGKYTKIIVTWGWTDDATKRAKKTSCRALGFQGLD